jgi:hypothetical protein
MSGEEAQQNKRYRGKERIIYPFITLGKIEYLLISSLLHLKFSKDFIEKVRGIYSTHIFYYTSLGVISMHHNRLVVKRRPSV